VDAVREGLFHIYPVETIDEGIEILTGVPAGRKLKDGSFEKGTVHEMVYNRLRQYAMSMAQFGRDNKLLFQGSAEHKVVTQNAIAAFFLFWGPLDKAIGRSNNFWN
jgi:hypothetical protein